MAENLPNLTRDIYRLKKLGKPQTGYTQRNPCPDVS